jgi:hypothetical protein
MYLYLHIFFYSSSIINIKRKKLRKTGTRFEGGVPHAPIVEK